ncbi:alpha/beta hydrolase [Nocardioides sp. GCM10027113]|uniref:alpha/beta hydrolase n=1 Tax=unclassified Nocardioides TaxID=2615069 RepID=UPI00360BF73F
MTEAPLPSLRRNDPAGSPRALVLVLHGGKARSRAVVDGRSASWQRARAVQDAITPAAHDAGAATWLVRFRHRGWNNGTDPVTDARWALDQARRELGDVPVVLLGHSMGARTAVHVADHDGVLGVVGLAPWFPPGEPVAALAGRHLLAVHGRRDRITSYRATAEYVDRASRIASSARLHDMGAVGHYMLRRVGDWNRVAAEGVLDLLGR